jgi:hypothetical protein
MRQIVAADYNLRGWRALLQIHLTATHERMGEPFLQTTFPKEKAFELIRL